MTEQKYIDRFHVRYKINEETGCWEWQAGKNNAGYGQYSVDGKTCLAHRFSAMIFGLDMSGEVMRHKCDNPACVNPAHLQTGSHQDNMDDKIERNRHIKGFNNGNAKLTESQILAIRAEYWVNPYRGAKVALAKKYSVSWLTIKKIIEKLTWKHI